MSSTTKYYNGYQAKSIAFSTFSITITKRFKTRQNHIMWLATTLVSITLLPFAVGQLMICPQVCSCIWRNGKQTTICENQNLISIPNQISPSTQVLDLNTNNFQILPAKAFQERGLINLQKLFLPRCKLGAIADDAFVQLTNLVELDLSDNLLTHVPVKALVNCTNLRRLLLNNNHIATINAESFASLHNLKFLNLSGCQTHTIEPHAFAGLNDLEYLYLHSNHLTTLAISVVSDLPALYSFDLYRNPWHCNCEMRETREWMLRNNVGQSLPPTCDQPERLNGLMWNSLDLDDFACQPDIITTTVELTKTVGSNATLSCIVKGLPEPKIFWFIDDGHYRNLSSPAMRGEKYHLNEERTEGTVHSLLTISGLDMSDDLGSFICSAENRAGVKSRNFTVFVLQSSAFSAMGANWSKVELACGVAGVLISVVLIFVLVTLFMIRSKRFVNGAILKKQFGTGAHGGPGSNGQNDMNGHDDLSLDKKPAHLSALLKNNSATVYPASASHPNATQYYKHPNSIIGQHLSMLGLDGLDKKPEIFLQPQQLIQQQQLQHNVSANNTPVPDLVAGSNPVHLNAAGYELNTYSSNGLNYLQQQTANGYHHQHQNSTPSSVGLIGDSTESYDPYGGGNGMSNGGVYNGADLATYHHQSDNDGLYRAVMVQPPVSQSSVISNAMALGTGNVSSATTGTPPPVFRHLSANNLYTQYQLSQSHYDLRTAQTSRISPVESFSGGNGGGLHPAHSQRHLLTTTPAMFEPTHHAYVLGNPAATIGNGQSMDIYEDDVFHPVAQQPLTNNYNPIYGHQSQAQLLDHQQMFHAPIQPIYGTTSATASKRSSPWSHSTSATVLHNHLHQHHLMTTPTMVRYSPDEGYGEEGSSTTVGGGSASNAPPMIGVVGGPDHLEGTEV